MEFPQYRKYKNNLSFFKVISESEVVEYKQIGKNWERIPLKAKILPDRNYINDMLHNYHPYWDKITVSEFEKFLFENQNNIQ